MEPAAQRRSELCTQVAQAGAAAPLLDVTAIGLSGLCVAHCLLLPLAAVALPFLGTWAQAEWVHMAFILAAVPLAALALVGGRWRAPPWDLLALAVAGLFLMGLGVLGWPTDAWERHLTVGGGSMLALAHGLNWRRRRCPARAG